MRVGIWVLELGGWVRVLVRVEVVVTVEVEVETVPVRKEQISVTIGVLTCLSETYLRQSSVSRNHN